MNPVVDDQHLSLYFENQNLVIQVIDQLKKDVGELDIDLEQSELYDHIHGEITNRIAQLLHGNTDELMTILYRSDLSEGNIQQALQDDSDQPYAAVVADLLIKRILQKVVIRNYYKNLAD